MKVNVSFRCYFGSDNHVMHYQELHPWDIDRWLCAYYFTHPTCTSISVLFVSKRSEADLDDD